MTLRRRTICCTGVRRWCGAMPGIREWARGRRTWGWMWNSGWRCARGVERKLDPGSEEGVAEKAKAQVRAKVEHPFLWLKCLFGYIKVRYRGLAKNTQRLALLFGAGQPADGEGTTTGAVRPWASLNRPYAPRQPSNGAVRGKIPRGL